MLKQTVCFVIEKKEEYSLGEGKKKIATIMASISGMNPSPFLEWCGLCVGCDS